jgi:ParB family chromosome partitioning protein
MAESIKTKEIKIDSLVPFAKHPFKPYTGRKYEALLNTIKESGVLVPIIVRPKDDKYEILSGHNRCVAAKEAGLAVVPAVVREDITDDEAKLIVTVTNLIQRSFADLSHSERAAALSEHYNAIKRQGKRSDLIDSIATMLGGENTSVTSRHKLKARDVIAQTYGLGGTTVAQYIRIEHLIDSLKERLDDGKISLRAAVELSYLSEDAQRQTNGVIEDSNRRVEVSAARELRSTEVDGVLSSAEIHRIVLGGSGSRVPTKSIKVNDDVYSRYFTAEQSDSDVSDVISQALEAWFAK